MSRRARLIEIEYPDFGAAAQLASDPPNWRVSLDDYRRRFSQLRQAMDRRRMTHLVVYGDREHFANLAWLTGFDPRFEEALCLIHPGGKPILYVGNEGKGYAPASPVVASGDVQLRLLPDLSLPDQPRPAARLSPFMEVPRPTGGRVGISGWKQYSFLTTHDAPSWLVDEWRELAGFENVLNAVDLFIDCDHGLRTIATAEEIAYFEWTNVLASEGMKRVLDAVRPGARDFDLLEEVRYNGVPLGCHMTLKCGSNRVSLASARGERIQSGGRFSCGICYWGANVCRCGWVAEDETGLPGEARGYLETFAGPYFEAMAAWFDALRIGNTGSHLHHAIHSRLSQELFHVFLNAGHLIGLDEWIAAPASGASTTPLRSGMVWQADVIPSHPDFYSSRMEDGYVVADAALQAELGEKFPALLERCRQRQGFLRGTLGLPIPDEVLPLSNLCGMVAPYVLRPRRVLAL